MRFSVVVPTYNGGAVWAECAKAISTQSVKPEIVYVIDSSSEDNSVQIAKSYDFKVKIIPRSEFNHGGTRNKAAKELDAIDVLVFLTQDAILDNPTALETMLSYFIEDHDVAAVCGRQIPHYNASPLAIHARKFNYTNKTEVKSKAEIPRLGIKTAFISNSFAAYKGSIFHELGGFPDDVILSEDMYMAAKMILAGYKVIYSAESCVRHSHNYTITQEFNRYFDIGVFHADNKFIMNFFGGVGGEGVRFICSEVMYLLKKSPLLIPIALSRALMKFVGFKLGVNYKFLPRTIVKFLSMHKGFWQR